MKQLSLRKLFWVLILCQCSLSSAFAQYSTRTLDSSLQGYYVVARKQTSSKVCKASDWTDRDVLPQIGMESAPQMHVSANQVFYYGNTVRCDVLGIRNRKPTTFVGVEASVAIDVDLKCFDEGEVSRKTSTLRLMSLGQEEFLIEARAGWAPEAWVKCRGN